MPGLVLVIAVAVLLGVIPQPAAAYSFLGCRFAGNRPMVDLVTMDLDRFAPAVQSAARAWNRARRVPGRFRDPMRTPSMPAADQGAAQVQIGRVRSVIDAWAWIGDPASKPPRCLGAGVDEYAGNRSSIYLNESSLDELNGDQQTLVVQHELGHALGLGHVSPRCRSRGAVMVQGPAKWTCGWRGPPPWPDDRAGVRRLYSSAQAGGR